MELPEENCGPRKQWAAEPLDTVMQRLANASLMSSDSIPSTNRTLTAPTQESTTAPAALHHMNKIYIWMNAVKYENASAFLGVTEEPVENCQRRQWARDPPETLLSLLEKAQLSRASSTFLINRGGLLIP